MSVDELVAKAYRFASEAFPSYRVKVDRIIPGSLQIRLYRGQMTKARVAWQLFDYELTTPVLMEAVIYRMREEIEGGLGSRQP